MKYCPKCSASFTDEMALCTNDGAVLRQSGAPEDPLIGRTVRGRYRILKRLGHGGMGVVYVAEQLSVGRQVALKILHPEFTRDEAFVQRFLQEARLAAGLNHPNIATIYDFDQDVDGRLFLVMEYLEGRALSDVVGTDGPMDTVRVAHLGAQIAAGLDAAHRVGVIHRDVKPHNVMVVADGDGTKLMDFGIARVRDAADNRLTRTGMILGSPAYMAPEQIEGTTITERTDIYSLGAVLYEMIAGVAAFTGPTATAVFMKHLNETPAPVSRLRPDVPPALDRLVMRMLERDPALRPVSMTEVASELRASAGMSSPVSTSVGQRPVGATVVATATRLAPAPSGAETMVVSGTSFQPAPPKRKSRVPMMAMIAGGVVVVGLIGLGGYLLWPHVMSTPAGQQTARELSDAAASKAQTATPSLPQPPAPVAQISPPPLPPLPVSPPPVPTAPPARESAAPPPVARPAPKPAPAPKPQAPAPRRPTADEGAREPKAQPQPRPAVAKAEPEPRPSAKREPTEKPVAAPVARKEEKPPADVAKADDSSATVVASTDPTAIHKTIETALRRAGLLLGARQDEAGVSVQVEDDRTVNLAGVLTNKAELDRTIQIVSAVPGVRGVNKRYVNLRSRSD